MAPIRVLHCVAGLGHGGYESLIMNLYRNIDREKVQFDFVSSFPGVYEPEIEALGGRIHRIPFITQKGPFVYTAALDRVLRAEPRYPIVHSHMDKFSGLVMKRAAKAGIPVRIAFEPGQERLPEIRSGMSVITRIDTGSGQTGA